MALDFSDAALGAAIAWGVQGSLNKASQDTQTDSGSDGTQTSLSSKQMDETVNTDVERELARMNDRQARNEPPANSINGFVGETVEDLSPGGSVTVRITATSGHNMDVKRLEFTRKSNHEYVHELGGNRVSKTHNFESEPPRTVHNGNPIVSKVTNNSSSSTTDVDFEGQMWGWATEQGRGGR